MSDPLVQRTRWVLAFDAGCSACQDVVGRVQSIAGSRVEARGQDDPEVHELLHSTMGEKIPHAPILLSVKADRVRGWTGPALSLRLAWLLGPVRSVKVVRALSGAEIRTKVVEDPTRRRLLRAAPALAVGGFVLSGGTAFADVNSRHFKHLEGKDAIEFLTRARDDSEFARLRLHLRRHGYREEQWEAIQLYHGKRLERTVVKVMHLSPRGEQADLAYGVESNGDVWRLALVGEGEDRRVLVVENGHISTITPNDPRTQVDWGCRICQGLCTAGCHGGCRLDCIFACAGDPICVALCPIICRAVCVYGGCRAANPCRRWC